MTRRTEPRGESQLSARLARAYPTLSTYSAAVLAEELCAIERAQRRHAERCCSGEDGGYVKLRVYAPGVTQRVHDPVAEERAGARIAARIQGWQHGRARLTDTAMCDAPTIELHGDPRGPVLLVQLPGEREATAVWSGRP